MQIARREQQVDEADARGALHVLLIESQPLFIEALSLALRRVWPRATFLCVQCCADGLKLLRERPCDIVIANVETLEDQLSPVITAAAPAPVIATANSIQNDRVFHALAAGARAYLPKTLSGDAICGAITVALSGGVCLPPQVASVLVDRGANRSPRTGRETEILAHLARGASNKAIARELGLSVATVKLHVQSILRSTGARNRVEAIVNARRLGLLG